jgi:hypothetical protein
MQLTAELMLAVKEHVYYLNVNRVNENSSNKRGGYNWLIEHVR